ncbi:hypothetical protein OROMI_026228 [Orobanche minor]
MRVQKYRIQILEQTSSKSFSAPKSLAQKYRKQTSPMFLGSKIKAGNLLHSQRQNHNKWIRERGSSTIIVVYSACIMEGENTLLIDDATIFQMEEDQDHERNISDSSDEDGSDSNSNDSDGVTDAEQESQNTVTIKKKKERGLTRLPKLRTAYTNSGGRKRRVKFDQLGRFTGKYRAEFPSFLGDLVREKVGISVFNWKDVKKEVSDKLWEEITRYYEIDETRRKYVMNRLGILLRSFRKRLYADHIFPNLGKPTKLAKIPRRYRTILLSQEHWDNFVTHTQTAKFKDVSGKTKLARKESLYQHRMGRGGYSALREKLIISRTYGPRIVESSISSHSSQVLHFIQDNVMSSPRGSECNRERDHGGAVRVTMIHAKVTEYRDQTVAYEVSSSVDPTIGSKRQKITRDLPGGEGTGVPKSSHRAIVRPSRSVKKATRSKSKSLVSGKAVRCFNCNAPGHVRANCRSPPKTCYKCGLEGHLFQFCERVTEIFENRAFISALKGHGDA